MRTPDAALGSTDQSNALGTHSVTTYYDVVSPVVVATAQINQSVFTFPLINLTVDTTVNWTNIEPGQDAWIGTTPGGSDIGVYRVKGSTGTLLVIGETAEGDAGLLIQPLRSAGFADNQYVTIIQRRSIWSVYPLILNGTFYENYNQLQTGFSQYPPPVTSIKCTTPTLTQYNHLWTFADAGQTYATITFLVGADAWPGNSTLGYQWTVPGSWTVTGGSITTNTFTARVPASATNYELLCSVVNDQVQSSKRVIEVWVKTHSGATAPLVMTNLDRVHWDETGAALGFTLNDTLLANIPDGSMIVIAQERLFNGAVIQTAVSQFVGWVTRIGQKTEPGLKSASPEFMTIERLLSLKRGTSQVWQNAVTITTWQQVPAALCSLSFAQFWLLSWRARGVLELFDFIPASLTAAGQRLPRIDVKAQTLWQQLVSLADGFQKRLIGCDPDGTIWVSRHPSLVSTYPRTSGAVVVRDTHDASIYHDIDWPRELYPKAGLIEGSAFSWDGVATLPTPLLSAAPGNAPGQGANDQKCENQVVDNQSTLNALTGNFLAFLNPDYPDVTVNYQGMRGSLIKPAQHSLIRIQIPASLSPTGIALDRYAIPASVDESYGEGGVVDTSVHYVFETTGIAGVTKPVPVSNSNVPLPPAPITFPNPVATVPPGLISAGVQRISLISPGGVNLTGNFQDTSPHYVPYGAPWSGTLLQWVPNGFDPGKGWIVTTTEIGYLTLSDGTYVSKHTFTNVSSVRSADASFAEANFFAVVSGESTHGTRCCYTTNGVTFTEVTIDATSVSGLLPGCYVSSKTAGRIVTSAATGASTNTAEVSSSHGASWGALSPAFLTSVIGMIQISAPWKNNGGDNIFYYSRAVGTSPGDHRFYRYTNGTNVSIAPTSGSDPYMPYYSRNTCEISVLNENRLLMTGRKAEVGGPTIGAWLTDDARGATPSWVNIVAPGGDVRRCALAGDDVNAGWLWGANGYIQQLDMSSGSPVLTDHSGDYDDVTYGDLIGFAGW